LHDCSDTGEVIRSTANEW